MVGRRTSLTAQVANDLESALNSGAFYEEAAAFAGVGERTLYTWLQRGRAFDEAEEAGGEPPEAEKLYGDLYRRLRTARARVRVHAAGIVMAAITASNAFSGQLPDANLALKYLERVDPERWGRVWRQTGPASEQEPEVETAALAERAAKLVDQVAAQRERRQLAAGGNADGDG